MITTQQLPTPPDPDHDARIYSNTWFVSTSFSIDANGDAVVDNDIVNFALSDADSDGLYDTIDLSIGDTVYGEGNLTDGYVDYHASDNTNDERISWSASGTVIQLGYHYFLVTFVKNPPVITDDASITARWYVGTYNVDIDGDQVDDVLDYVLVDDDSDGLYTIMNLDTDDSGSYTTSSPDEELSSGDYANLAGQLVQVTFPLNPLSTPSTLHDGGIVTVTRRNENQWLLLVPASADVGGVQDQIQIKIAHPDDADPGFYKITGILEQYEPQAVH